jgi:nitrogen fixation/metabolism regulation signal transduction histidine kinase
VVTAPLKRYGSYGLVALGVLLGLAALLLLARSVENSTQFSRWQPWILVLNICAVVFFAVVLARKIWQLARDYRNHVPGSRLTARTVLVFGSLVVAPLLVVYLFSLDFLNRGIDSWFRVEVKQGLGDALVLSRASLDLRMREQGRRTEEFARQLTYSTSSQLLATLDAERRRTGALEMIIFGRNGELLASSSEGSEDALHARPPTEMLLQISENRPYVSLEPRADGGYVISTAAPIPGSGQPVNARFVLALYGVPQQLAALSEAVQHTYSQYGELAVLREPLKNSFRVTLTLVLLLAMLVAIYLAIFSAQRLTRPVQDLIEGTRAVGKGDFAMRLPLPSRDEMGFLVHSFNDMTKRLKRASEEATRSRQIVEQERERLAVILARLSTGVLVVDPLLRLRIVNEAAGSILGVDLTADIGRSLSELSTEGNPRLGRFVYEVSVRLGSHQEEWREQVELPPDRVLRCACSPLDAAAGEPGYVIVFDDITNLLQAQREAAWGEVARRLAHEIKNPLTPIQLSAERLRRRLLGNLPVPEDAELLERSTRTIVQQVETMKAMVNAFSEYARAPEIKLVAFDLNNLVTEVAELYRAQDGAADIRVQVDPALGSIRADRGRLRQVLNNLITNGIEAVGETPGGWVEVTTQRQPASEGGCAVITVTDNGHGFQKEMLARVFDPYVTSKQKGTGLGLAIVKKITEEHGGRIEADNRPEGGARVRVVLPVAANDVSQQPQRVIA